MNNIQYFSNGIRRFQVGGTTSYSVPVIQREIVVDNTGGLGPGLQYLHQMRVLEDIRKLEAEREYASYQAYLKEHGIAPWNMSIEQWRKVKDVPIRRAEIRQSNDRRTPQLIERDNKMRELRQKADELAAIFGRSLGANHDMTVDEINLNTALVGSLVIPELAGSRFLSGTLGLKRFLQPVQGIRTASTSAPKVAAQYFTSLPLSLGTRMAITADGTAVAIPSVSVNIPSMLPSLGASTVLGKLLYDGRTMNAESSEARSQRLAQEAEQASSSETSTPEPPKEPEKKEEPNNTPEPKDNNPKNKLDNVKQWGKKAWKWGRIPLIGYGLYSAYNAGRQVGEGNKRLGNPQDQAMQDIMQLQGLQPIHLDTLPYEESLRYLDSLNKISQLTKIDTLD